MNRSAAAVAKYLPSGEMSSARTASLWSRSNFRTSAPPATSHHITSPSRDGTPPPVAKNFPSGLNFSAVIRSANGDSPGPPPSWPYADHFPPVSHPIATPSPPPATPTAPPAAPPPTHTRHLTDPS